MLKPQRGVLALSGGVGGAKLAAGLARCLSPESLTIAANTGDDFVHLGLHISPDLDSVMYALAGINDRRRGWGLEDESWEFMAAMQRLGGETWFQLGDRDLATHTRRSQLLAEGLSLSAATEVLSTALDVQHSLVPMSDDPVRTMVLTDKGRLEFQHYFVERQCEPRVSGFYFDGIEEAVPHPGIVAALKADAYRAVIICPSNPFVSVDPIVNLSGVRDAIAGSGLPVLAVSPLIGGKALKGPAAKMMGELNRPTDAFGIAQYYAGLVSHFVIDQTDENLRPQIEALGMKVIVAQTIMRSSAEQEQLARVALEAADCVDLMTVGKAE